MNYYNEFDAKAAAWLRELIAADMTPKGDVDERSIVDVRPADLAGYTSCHFFAGIGGWPYALRLAGWPDDRPVWTGSCPCQPFSLAGKRAGTADERHLWPAWFALIRECRPPVVFGEQVAAAVSHGWLDAVFTDLEGEGYSCGAVVLPACSVGTPHKRERLWFVAESDNPRCQRDLSGEVYRGGDLSWAITGASGSGPVGFLDHGVEPGLEGPERPADMELHRGEGSVRPTSSPGPTNGYWSSAVWLPCRDGKRRPTGPGISPLVARVADAAKRGQRAPIDGNAQCGREQRFLATDDGSESRSGFAKSSPLPLADGLPEGVGRSGDPSASADADNTAEARVMRLRGYGNAIVPQVAAEFIRAYMEVLA